jgi:hypothetical protein
VLVDEPAGAIGSADDVGAHVDLVLGLTLSFGPAVPGRVLHGYQRARGSRSMSDQARCPVGSPRSSRQKIPRSVSLP